jgi:hypothetical protein
MEPVMMTNAVAHHAALPAARIRPQWRVRELVGIGVMFAAVTAVLSLKLAAFFLVHPEMARAPAVPVAAEIASATR